MDGLDHITQPSSPPHDMGRVKHRQTLKASANLLRDQSHYPERGGAMRPSEVLASRRLATQRLQLDEASLMKSASLATLSHDLRTPLNAIIGFSELLDDGSLGELSPGQKEAVNDILTSGNLLLALINDILDLSRVETGKLTLELDALKNATLVRAGPDVLREVAPMPAPVLVGELPAIVPDIPEFPSVFDCEGGTVLVVDDDPKAVRLLGTYMKSTGYRILMACSWQDGIDLARSKLPDLIVLDLMMPEVNGFEVVEALKRDTSTSGIPIIIVTAKQVTAEDRARLGEDVLKVIEKSELNQGRLVREITQAMGERNA